MILYRAKRGLFLVDEGRCYVMHETDWGRLINRPDLAEFLASCMRKHTIINSRFNPDEEELLPPIDAQEVWAAGVTYYRSRDARLEESRQAGGGDFYARVYDAERPELFFKSTPHRTAGHRQKVRIRKDSTWNVPEPELALFINNAGAIAGYTIGNDMSSRDIEGENPLYIPQAKVYDQSCALGPGLFVGAAPLPPATEIRLSILRRRSEVFSGTTTLDRLKRTPKSLAEYLFRDNSFPNGCFLLTGTGIVPPKEFTLRPGDEILITLEPIGTLSNIVM